MYSDLSLLDNLYPLLTAFQSSVRTGFTDTAMNQYLGYGMAFAVYTSASRNADRMCAGEIFIVTKKSKILLVSSRARKNMTKK
jgi:hypothetical protein